MDHRSEAEARLCGVVRDLDAAAVEAVYLARPDVCRELADLRESADRLRRRIVDSAVEVA